MNVYVLVQGCLLHARNGIACTPASPPACSLGSQVGNAPRCCPLRPSSFRFPCRTPYSLWPALRLGRLVQCGPSVQLGRDGSAFNHHLPETYQARTRVACCSGIAKMRSPISRGYSASVNLAVLDHFCLVSRALNSAVRRIRPAVCPWPADLGSLRVLRICVRAFTTESKRRERSEGPSFV